MEKRFVSVLSALFLGVGGLGVVSHADTSRTPEALDKKLIEYGWDVPFPDYIRANIRAMEKRPFDGLIFKLRGGGKVLTPVAWDEAKFAKDYEDLKHIEWKSFTDNFVIMWAASDQDWFNDKHWRAITHNVALVARAARIGRCVGVCFDQEPYGTNPWAYTRSVHRGTKSFAEYEAKTRQRGAEFLHAVESEFPGAAVLTLFQLSYFAPLLVPMQPAQRAARLSEMQYSLLPAFLNGMLEAASPSVKIIDGNEAAYYYTSRDQHLEVYHRIKQRGQLLIDPPLWTRYSRQVQAGQALYIDQYFGLRTRQVLGHHMTADERPKWFEHNVYWSLNTTDEYVWCYSERMNWWKDTGVPPGCEPAIRSAREKLRTGGRLGFDLKPIVEAARKRGRAEIAKRLKVRSAPVRHLPVDTVRPTVDGLLNDAAWQVTKPLSDFVALATRPQQLKAGATARVTYDTRALYVAVSCREPARDKMHVVGRKHDDPVWQGDTVEMLIAAPGRTIPFYHFMLNPRGVQWDGLHTDANADLSYNPEWQHAVGDDKEGWTVEMAIPWSALHMAAPERGTTLRANICRQRGKGRELSAWSPMATGFLEHDLFGTWVFEP